MIIIIFGVAGAGKTTVGRLLAQQAGWEFIDADDYHSPTNVEKMSSGTPLTDDDREGWLMSLAATVADRARRGQNAVLACSALKAAYRQRLASATDVRFAYLKIDPSVADARLAARKGHFMNRHLLDSQFETLEEPGADIPAFDASEPPEEIVRQIRALFCN